MDTLLQDLRYAARRLLKSPGFSLVAVLTLALGIGANSAIFSVVNAVLLRPLPFEEPQRLMRVFAVLDGNDATFSPADFFDVREQAQAFQSLTFFHTSGLTLTGVGDPAALRAARVGADYFATLGVQPLLGRAFLPDENQPGDHRVVVLSHALWQQRFGGDEGVIGRTLTLNGEPYQVVGVLPEGIGYPSNRDLWTPQPYDEEFAAPDNRGMHYISVLGRLRPEATVEQADRELATIAARLEQNYPDSNTNKGMNATPLPDVLVGDIRAALLILLGAVGLVLLIACTNVANLLLSRAAARQGELAVRSALGAGRRRLIRQMLTESVVLGLVGGALGLLLAVWGTQLLIALQPRGIPRLHEVGIDARVVAFTLGVSVLTGLLFGLLPALQVTRGELAGAIREGGRSGMMGRGSGRVRNALVVLETALAVILLAGAGLLMRSFVKLQAVDPGFRTEGVLAFRLSLPEASYPDAEARVAFYDQLLERMRALPGATAAAAVQALPMSGLGYVLTFDVEGREPARPGEEPALEIRSASPDYFALAGIPLLRGRGFSEQDDDAAPRVAVLTETAVRRHFAGEDPIGKRLTFDEENWYEVVGVVGDVRQYDLAEAPEPGVYLPLAQEADAGMDVVVRTDVPPLSLAGAVRREVDALDPNLPVFDVRPVEQIVAESVSQPRFYMLLLGIFAGVALVLAAIGIFGVMSYTVAQRTREIGIRVALGADPDVVLRLVVGGAMALSGAGLALGLLGAFAGTRLLNRMLYQVSATDPPTFIAVPVLLAAVALLASYLPARRATRVDPMVALRAD